MSLEGEKEKRSLEVKLSKKVVLERAHELIAADEELERLEAERKEEMDKYKDLKEDTVRRKKKLRDAVKNGVEFEEVDCTWEADYQGQQWKLKRDDTNVIVEEITMSSEDLQENLEIEDDEQPEDEEDAIETSEGDDDEQTETNGKRTGGKRDRS